MKTMRATLILSVALASLAFADSNVVSSANVVGYVQKSVVSNSFTIVSPQFLVADTNGVALSDAFSDIPDNSVVYAWDNGYTRYVYFGGLWYNMDDGYAPADDVIIKQGAATWLQSTATTNVVMSGDVPQASSITNEVVEGFTLMANPYPVGLTLGDMPTNSLPDNSVVYAWDGSYTRYIYFGGLWYNMDDGYAPADDVAIDVGDGFWMESTNTFNMIFDKQY